MGLRWETLAAQPLEPAMHMAVDEVLLSEVAAGRRGPSLRFWRWTRPAIVLGSHQSVANEVDLDAAADLGFVVVRRMSGGGTMLAEPGGTITYSLYLPDSALAGLSFVASYERLDSWAVRGLRSIGVDAAYRPINDIISPLGKIGGAAQARRRGAVLHHTTIAHCMDPDRVPRLIRLGRQSVSAVGLRSAEKAVSPLSWFTTRSLEEVERSLAESFAAEAQAAAESLTAGEMAAARELARIKYSTREWTYRLP